MKRLAAIAALVLLVSGCIGQNPVDSTPTQGMDYTDEENLVVQMYDTVSVTYTGRFLNSTVFDSNEGGQPLTFVAGSGQLISGFDQAVLGMKMNEEKTVTIPPEEAYGTTGDHPLANETLVFDIKVTNIVK